MRPFPSAWVRHRQVRALERFMSDNPIESRCVVGDYNATPVWPLYRRLRRSLSDGAVDSARKEGRAAQPTWGPRPASRRILRIDHAMVQGLEVERFQVVEIPGSDHSGILFDCAPRA
jgi:endonuclease/exonuclease/phosphatase family metal-dependent hydrolase